jgi:hypothetical protein
VEQPIDELTRQALHVRMRELRHLERCERGLAEAYRQARGLPGIPDHQLGELARRHLAHAEILRDRLLAMGGIPEPEPEDMWVTGSDAAALRLAEHTSMAVYHDHLLDFDVETASLMQRAILPDHAEALALLDPHYERDRDGDL